MQPIGSPRCIAKGSWSPPSSARASSALLPEFGVGVERQVVCRERDVGLEEDLQAALEQLVDRAGTLAPEEAVVDEQQVGVLAGRQFEQLGVRRNARGQARDFGRPGHLQPVRAVILEVLRLEQLIDRGDELGRRDGHRAKIRPCACGILWALRRGVAQPGSAHRSGR